MEIRERHHHCQLITTIMNTEIIRIRITQTRGQPIQVHITLYQHSKAKQIIHYLHIISIKDKTILNKVHITILNNLCNPITITIVSNLSIIILFSVIIYNLQIPIINLMVIKLTRILKILQIQRSILKRII